MSFGTKLKKARERKGMTRVSLARAVGVSVYTVYLWENDVMTPKPEHLESIMRVLEEEEDER